VFLPELASSGGMPAPTLFRDGGPFTDTSRDLTLQVRFLNPQPLGPVPVTANSSTYHLPERQPQLFHTHGLSADLGASPAGHTRTRLIQGASVQKGTHSGLRLMTPERAAARTRSASDLMVSADALVEVVVRFRNTRGTLTLPSRPRARLRYRLRNALALGFSPESADTYGQRGPGGVGELPPAV
jgi:hypothetical protein